MRASSQASRAAGASRGVAGGLAAGGCVEVQTRWGWADVVQVGDAFPSATRMQDGRCMLPHLQQVRFSAYKTFFEDTKDCQPIKSQSPRLSHDEQYLSHFASLQILLACSIENLLDTPSSIPGRAQKVF